MTAEKKYLIVTNNYKANRAYHDHPMIGVDFLEGQGYLDVLIRVRDYVHGGWHLLTHPQASNLKPMQTPYKSVMVTAGTGFQPLDRDIDMIESAIAGYHKFTRGMRAPTWTDRIKDDFCTVDLSVIESAINSPGMQNVMQNGF